MIFVECRAFSSPLWIPKQAKERVAETQQGQEIAKIEVTRLWGVSSWHRVISGLNDVEAHKLCPYLSTKSCDHRFHDLWTCPFSPEGCKGLLITRAMGNS